MKGQKFRKLDVWNKAMEFISSVYRETGKFPAEETYGLTSQMRRAAVSIALNIAEGSGSESDNEFKRFLGISLKSSYEVMCAIEVAFNLGYFTEAKKDMLLKDCDEVSAMIGAFIKKLKADGR